MKCLQKEKDQRYQSAGEVRSELEKIEQGLPTTERIVAKKKPTTSREITVKFSLDKHLKWGLIFAAEESSRLRSHDRKFHRCHKLRKPNRRPRL